MRRSARGGYGEVTQTAEKRRRIETKRGALGGRWEYGGEGVYMRACVCVCVWDWDGLVKEGRDMNIRARMKLVPSGHSDCSFYSVTCHRGGSWCTGRVADTQHFQYH